jgi:TolB-like protein/DNA-binding winged helix-turn-helix (wHTH) protein/rhodanese-related sulfurtransferase
MPMDDRQEEPQRAEGIILAHEPSFVLGSLSVSPSTREIQWTTGSEIIEPRVMQVLVCLARSEGAVVSRDDLIRCCWGGRIVGDDAINRCIGKVRQIAELGDGSAFGIETVPRVGYRLRRVSTASAPPSGVSIVEVAAPAPEPDAAVRPPERSRLEDLSGPAGRVSIPTAEPAQAIPAKRRRKRLAIATASLLGLVILLAVGSHFRDSVLGHPAAPRLSIAVLPFRNLSDDPHDDYLADAVGDDLTTALAHLPGSFVISRNSVDAYKAHAIDPVEVGRELGVRYLLVGSLRRLGDTVSINAQLIDTGTGAQLWAERFDAHRQQLADTQTTIVRHIAGALDYKLVQLEVQRSLEDRGGNPDALDLFLRARSRLDRDDTFQGLADAQPMLERAIALQPDFVDGMAELAWLLLRKMRDFDDPTDVQDMANARRLVDQAIRLAPRNPRVLTARGFLLKLDRRCQEAIASYQLALSLDPNDTDARDGIALCAAGLGHPDEAARQLQETLAIDPQDPKNSVRYNQLGLLSLMLGRDEDAIGWFLKATAGDPDTTEPNDNLTRREWNDIGLIAGYSLTGRLADAKAKYARYASIRPNRTTWRLTCYFTKAETALPGFRAMLDGLKAAGMPEYSDETIASDVKPTTEPTIAGDFAPTPSLVPGARTMTTKELASLLAGASAPMVVDVGCGAATIADAVWINDSFPSQEGQADLDRALAGLAGGQDRPIVVMGCGKYDWNAYNAALSLIAAGYRKVAWYRGGEEAWTAAGLKAEDRRNP